MASGAIPIALLIGNGNDVGSRYDRDGQSAEKLLAVAFSSLAFSPPPGINRETPTDWVTSRARSELPKISTSELMSVSDWGLGVLIWESSPINRTFVHDIADKQLSLGCINRR